MKWLKDNAVPFLMTAAACAVGVAILAPMFSALMAKFKKTA